jgi:hypothetical protein
VTTSGCESLAGWSVGITLCAQRVVSCDGESSPEDPARVAQVPLCAGRRHSAFAAGFGGWWLPADTEIDLE